MSNGEIDNTLAASRRRRQDYLNAFRFIGEGCCAAHALGELPGNCFTNHPWTQSQITEQERATRQEQTDEDEGEDSS